jgi:ATP-dependent DNA helicase RecG
MEAYDEQALPEMNLEAPDFRAASELFSNYKPLPTLDWETRRTTTGRQNRQAPTIDGVPQFLYKSFYRFPDAWVQVGRFAGNAKAPSAAPGKVRSLLPIAVNEVMAFTLKHLMVESVIEDIRR